MSGSARTDRGFTLIELLIVTTIIGVIVGSLSAAFLVIVKTSPSTEIRVDDARSTRGLATYLSHDTTSAPPYDYADPKGWIDTSAGAGNCGGAGANIVQFSWLENGFSSRTFYANYRFVTSGSEASVVRYSCSSTTPTRVYNLTAGLDPADPPDVILNKVGGDVVSVDFVLHASSGADVVVETGSRNPVEFYP